jgi:hypothetical protein
VVHAVLLDLRQDQRCIVVALLGAADQLASLDQQRRALGDTEGAQQGQLQRTGGIPGELAARQQEADLLAVLLRVQRCDIARTGESVPRRQDLRRDQGL